MHTCTEQERPTHFNGRARWAHAGQVEHWLAVAVEVCRQQLSDTVHPALATVLDHNHAGLHGRRYALHEHVLCRGRYAQEIDTGKAHTATSGE